MQQVTSGPCPAACSSLGEVVVFVASTPPSLRAVFEGLPPSSFIYFRLTCTVAGSEAFGAATVGLSWPQYTQMSPLQTNISYRVDTDGSIPIDLGSPHTNNQHQVRTPKMLRQNLTSPTMRACTPPHVMFICSFVVIFRALPWMRCLLSCFAMFCFHTGLPPCIRCCVALPGAR